MLELSICGTDWEISMYQWYLVCLLIEGMCLLINHLILMYFTYINLINLLNMIKIVNNDYTLKLKLKLNNSI